MASLREIIAEAKTAGIDKVREKYLTALSNATTRNVIAYYSGFHNHQGNHSAHLTICDADMNGFMTTIQGLDRSKGLDIILHTPGGEINATEAIVNYLHYAFNGDIRAIIPHQAMSAGTMIALSCKTIIMGEHSSLGPIDPQVGGAPAHGIIEEFKSIQEEFISNPHGAQAYLPILKRYTPTLIGSCDKAIRLSEEIVGRWLLNGMLNGKEDAEEQKKKILEEFGSHERNLNHARHFNFERVRDTGVDVARLEDQDNDLQNHVLSVHHAFTVMLASTQAYKVIQNHLGANLCTFSPNTKPVRPAQPPAQP